MDITMLQGSQAPISAVTAEKTAPDWLVENREMIRAVKAVDATELFGQDSEFSFQLDRETQKPILKVINRQTREVMLQLPPEYILRVAEEMQKYSKKTGMDQANQLRADK